VTAPNAELAYKVLDAALAHEGHFDMAAWGDTATGRPASIADLTSPNCGTVACLAGWTVAMAGHSVDSGADLYDASGNSLGRKADDLAAELLGITEQEAGDLFYSSNDDVEDRIAEIFGPRPATFYGPDNPQCPEQDPDGLDCAGPIGHPEGGDHANVNGTWPIGNDPAATS
jgi:hypothetical protein